MDPAARQTATLIATHIAPARGFGGVAECAATIARAWARQGRDFSVAVSDGSHGIALRTEDLGLPVQVPVRLYRARWPVRWGFGWGAPAAIWAACREAGVCYICGIATWPTTLAYLVCRWLGRPYVAATHGGLMPAHVARIRREKPLKWLFYRLLVLPALHRAAAIHVTSPLEADGVRAWVPDASIVEIPNGIDVAFWRAPVRTRSEGDGLCLCYVGRLSREKGIRRFLEIWGHARAPADRLIIVGDGDGDYADAVRRLAARIGPTVTMAGALDRVGVRATLAQCDFLVLPSGLDDGDVRENFGIAAAEALAAGRPLLLPRGLAWDMAEDEGFGILFTPDEAGVKTALRRAAAADPGASAQAAIRWAADHCDLDNTAARLWQVVSAAGHRTTAASDTRPPDGPHNNADCSRCG